MFFRREKPRTTTFADRLESLKQNGFAVAAESSRRARVQKHGCAVVLEDRGESQPSVGDVGVVVGGQIAHLVNGGYQQFFQLPTGRKLPALAEQLRALHDFNEDLKEALGATSLYNQGLGTTSELHMYDRVVGRDAGRH